MSQALHHAPPAEFPEPRVLASPMRRAALAAATILALVGWLHLLGRPLLCPCGTVGLWVGDPSSPTGSQQFADWYSALHFVFGLGLFVTFDRLRPNWPTSDKLVLTIASSAIWEGIENIPFVIALFGHSALSPAYAGDSILNALGDTVFVVFGFLVARVLPLWGVIALGLGVEALVSFVMDDGFVIGLIRLVGIPV